jgi:signal transduction histidine kinase
VTRPRVARLAWMRHLDPGRVDALAGLVIFLSVELYVWSTPSLHGRVLPAIAGLVFGAAVAVRRRLPLAGLMVIMGVLTVKIVTGAGPDGVNGAISVLPAVVLLTYGMGAFAPPRRSMPALGVVLVVSSVNMIVTQGKPLSALVPSALLVTILPYALGRRVRAREQKAQLERERSERIDASRDVDAQVAVSNERTRLARELHDVVAHAVSVMVIQCGAARTVMGSEPERAELSLRNVERAGRDALAEMRRLVAVLERGGAPTGLAPPPGLHDLDGLVAGARASGLAVNVAVDGSPVPMPAALDLCAYRVLQEALTNAVKHAARAKAIVRIHWRPDALDLEVSNSGQHTGALLEVAGGHGLVGMRERVTMHGGTLDAGATPDGGYTVKARLPLAAGAVR